MLTDRLKARYRRLLERPGTTVDVARLAALVPAIQQRATALSGRTDAELTAAARELRGSADAAGPDGLVAACAVGREAARRGLGQDPFDVQLVGALAMLSGHVAEMATGEGKTLAAAVAASAYVLAGRQVHVLTANDYLARRDAEWMEPLYRRLGLTVGWVAEGRTPEQRAAAYAADVTYLTVSEAGFDYLRDGLRVTADGAVQRGLDVVIIDEADAILVDEAQVPLVLAGRTDGSGNPVTLAARLVGELEPARHYQVGEDARSVELTDGGVRELERRLGGTNLYAPEQLELFTALNVALYAQALLHRDVDYLVRGGGVELIDGFRGRVAQRRRWPDGLQSAVEAKEGLPVRAEGEVLATITVQSFIDLYQTTCGMTGTALLAAEQLREFYRLEVAVVPRNRPNIRVDEPDRLYATAEQQQTAVLDEVATAHVAGRPVLVGTLDVAESERLAAALDARGIESVVLNARNDAAEAAIIAAAGEYGRVTVSTQMAGRGTDIRLGGTDQADYERVAALGGLYVIGSGRHDSRRVDDQLRGRAGRQGDPGGSVFFVSLEDDLLLRHDPAAIPTDLPSGPDGRVADEAGQEAVEHAQRVAEGVSLEIHRNTWRYHVLIEQQRNVMAEHRNRLLSADAAGQLLRRRRPERCAELVARMSEDAFAAAARSIMLHHVDRCWTEHLARLADLREGVHLRALGRLDPLTEFHREAVPAFRGLLTRVEARTVATFDETDISEPGWRPADAGLDRPTGTWTYQVHDNPFGTELERALVNVVGIVLGRQERPRRRG